MTDVDDWDDADDDEPDWEPDCGGCWDTGVARPRRWWQQQRTFTRRRASRARCASCNPSPRQERRNAYRARRDAEQWQRDVAAGRITLATFDDRPF